MLNKINWSPIPNGRDAQTAPRDEPSLHLTEVIGVVTRQWRLVGGVLALAVAGAIAYLLIAPPRYTASSMMLIDTRKVQLQPQSSSSALIDSAYVDSQVEILKTIHISKAVIDHLDLLSDPEFTSPSGNPLHIIRRWFNAVLSALFGVEEADSSPLARATMVFQANLTIKRLGLTYIIQVDYRSLDPGKAARISNAVMEAYILDQLQSRYQGARRADAWLQERLEQLRLQAQAAERAAAEYTAKNNAADSGARLRSEQQLADMSNERRTTLTDLESVARTRRGLYESFLQQVTEITQRELFPSSEARVVTEAVPPSEKSDPKPLIVLGAASILGLFAGLGAAFTRERLHNTFRLAGEVEKTGISCLGILPTIKSPRWSARQPAVTAERIIACAPGRYRFVIDHPRSRFSETIRSIEVAAGLAAHYDRGKVIGVSSALPGEGKSLVAANLGELIADAGDKVLLIDADLRKPGLTRQLAPEAERGLIDVIAGSATLDKAVWQDPITNLEFLPAVLPLSRARPSSGVLSSAQMQELLAPIKERYDHIVLDLPPILPFADVKAVSQAIDSFILVIEWGRTSEQAVIEALDTLPPEKLLGAVLNKADRAVLNNLEKYKGRFYQAYESAS